MQLIRQSRNNSKSNRYNSSAPLNPIPNTMASIDDIDNVSPMMRNKSNQSNSALHRKMKKKRTSKKQKNGQKQLKKHKSKSKDNKENNNNNNNKDLPRMENSNNYIYSGSANTIIDDDESDRLHSPNQPNAKHYGGKTSISGQWLGN